MKFKQKQMVRWYDVRQLAATGIKTVISSIFGNFADRREIQAVLGKEEHFDYSDREELWVDYIADLGDGFNSTYSMAHLMAKEQLAVAGESAQRGNVLIMGGDQVYPVPSKEQYENRLQGPYNAAYPWDDADPKRPHLYAIPGNHDWYDGLSNFIKLFCQGRALGNWHTRQHRSYFALKLPHNYWIWAIDVQLSSDIDKPQLDYFDKMASQMNANDRIILCTAEPTWVYASVDKANRSSSRLSFFKDRYSKGSNLRFLLTLTGDLHHYSRYVIQDATGRVKEQMLTSGGGGAFTHPTHFLKEQITLPDASVADLKACYPSKGQSRRLVFLNLFFPFLNHSLALTFGFFHVVAAWFLQSTTKYMGGLSFMEQLKELPFSWANLRSVFQILSASLSHNPVVVLTNLALVTGLIMSTDTSCGRGRWNYVGGVLHSFFQLSILYILIWTFSRINLHFLDLDLDSWQQVALFSVEMLVLGSLLCGIVFGLHLISSALIFQAQPTESFSSLRLEGYKNFLRIHVTRDHLKIYPFGVENVVKNWKNIGSADKPRFEGDAIQYFLIETPIIIKTDKYE